MEDSSEDLTSMVDSFVNGNEEQAQIDFHRYLKPKIQSTVQPMKDDSSTED